MNDFTLTIYKELLVEFLYSGYKFMTFAEFMETQPGEDKLIILRHDVDRLPEQAKKMAEIEYDMGVKASYYFRCQRHGFDESSIRDIAALGHEIGYHYEDLSCFRGDCMRAIDAFEKNLSSLRKLAEVKTICMHGSPLGKFDNRKLWERYDYRNFDIIGEPYFDLNFSKVLYLTDTGRRWDGDKVSIRDRSDVKHSAAEKLHIKKTVDLIQAIVLNALPDQVLINIHPHRWFDFGLNWLNELISQNMKNIFKAALLYFRHD